jgi:hypothetical protein
LSSSLSLAKQFGQNTLSLKDTEECSYEQESPNRSARARLQPPYHAGPPGRALEEKVDALAQSLDTMARVYDELRMDADLTRWINPDYT